MTKQNNNAEKSFLEHLKKTNQSTTVFLANGVKLQGKLTWHDENTLTLYRDGITQLVYKNTISTVMPSEGFTIASVLGHDVNGNK